MGIQRSQEDSWTKEMAKWERVPVFVNGSYIQPIPVQEGGRLGADLTEFPKMLYRAKSADGGPVISGWKTVKDSTDERLACGQGWSVTQEAAIALVHAEHVELARLAANRVYQERGMSERARAEAAAVDESTMLHVAEIPRTPVKKRVRRTKAQIAADAAKGH